MGDGTPEDDLLQAKIRDFGREESKRTVKTVIEDDKPWYKRRGVWK